MKLYLHSFWRISLLNCNGPNVAFQQERTPWSPLRKAGDGMSEFAHLHLTPGHSFVSRRMGWLQLRTSTWQHVLGAIIKHARENEKGCTWAQQWHSTVRFRRNEMNSSMNRAAAQRKQGPRGYNQDHRAGGPTTLSVFLSSCVRTNLTLWGWAGFLSIGKIQGVEDIQLVGTGFSANKGKWRFKSLIGKTKWIY